MTSRMGLPGAALLLLASCRPDLGANMTAERAAQLARADFDRELPQMARSELRIETRDLGGRWRVSFVPPPGSTGGPFILDVDKQSGAVTWISAEQ